MRVVALSVLAVASVVCADVAPPPPAFHRLLGNRVQAVIPGIPGVKAVTLTLVTKSQIRHAAHLTKAEADKTWKTILHDVTKSDDDGLTYVIQYTLQDGVHEATGSVQFTKDKKQQKQKQQQQQHLEVPVTRQSSEKKRRSTVVFHDEFQSGSIDPSKWTHAITGFGGGSNQVHMLTPEPANSYVKHNTLYIKPTLTADRFGEDFLKNGTLDFNATWGGCNSVDHRGCYLSGGPGKIPPIMSAMLMSKASIRYGKVTVNARLPKGDWLWPAIWLLPTEYHYGPWPMSGEIDITESRGNAHYHHHWTHLSMGRDYTHAAIHYGSHYDKYHRRAHSGEFRINGTTFTDGFHSFWMDWTADYIRIGVDGHTVMDWPTPPHGYWQESHLQGQNVWVNGSKAAPFDRPFYLILNVSVGGGWFWDGMDNAPYPQPWQSNATKAEQFQQFWNARHLWEPTWHGENVAMRIRSVTMEQY